MTAERARAAKRGTDGAGAPAVAAPPRPDGEAGQSPPPDADLAVERSPEQRIWRRFLQKLSTTHPGHPWTRTWLDEAVHSEPPLDGAPPANPSTAARS